MSHKCRILWLLKLSNDGLYLRTSLCFVFRLRGDSVDLLRFPALQGLSIHWQNFITGIEQSFKYF